MRPDPGDLEALLAAQLGRPPRGRWEVAVRCPFGFPAVIETAPYLDDGTPFPTLYYLTCPSAVDAVARLEASGGVEAFRERLAVDPEAAAAVEALDRVYRRRRAELASPSPLDGGAVFERGIGGPSGPAQATCLHAYLAALLAATARPSPLASGDDPWADEWRRLLDEYPALWCDDARCSRLAASAAVRRAAIDVGTNSVRLLVALVEEGVGVRTLARRAEVTQLGAGLIPGGRLDRAAAERTREVVVRYVAEARAHGVESIRLVGTSACRDAEDGRSFIRGLGAELLVTARVVSGPEEAALSYVGATYDIAGDPVIVDVGGGSTELVRRSGVPGPSGGGGAGVDAESLDLGCVRETEASFTSDPPSASERASLRRRARKAFEPLASRFGAPTNDLGIAPGARAGGPGLVGVAGTVTTLACIVLGLEEYDPEVIHLSRLTQEELATTVDSLAGLTPDQRAALPCMQPGRARVIVAGGEILLGVMEALGWRELMVSERDILDGLVLSAGKPVPGA